MMEIKKKNKILIMFALFLLFFIIYSNTISATTVLNLYDGTAPLEDGTDKITKMINNSIGTVQVVGVFIATAMLIILGIKYISASPGERAEIKKHLVVYVTGAIVFYGAAGILEIVEKIALNMTA